METALVAPSEGQADLEPLNERERADLAQCEEVIGQGLQSFVEVGRALQAVRDGRLYRAEYRRFSDYCRDRWLMGRAHANRYIDASTVVSILSPIGDSPTKEAQVRSLTKVRDAEGHLDQKMIVKLWRRAVDMASGDVRTGKRVTAKIVERVVKPLIERRRRHAQDGPGMADDDAGENCTGEDRVAGPVQPAPLDGPAGVGDAHAFKVNITDEEFAKLRICVGALAKSMRTVTLPESVRSLIEDVCEIVLG